jgi:glycosyltransferase involved in cell wall biosynthesis
MERKRILWLVSWYPNQNDPFDGDFIQRHARAAALYHDIHILFVTQAEISEPFREELRQATGLTEQVIYFKKRAGILSKLMKQVTWRKTALQAADAYIAKYGLPHLIHVHIPWKAGLIGLELKRKYSLDMIVTEHWGIYNQAAPDHFQKQTLLTRSILKKVFDASSLLLAPSAFLAEGVNRMVSPVAIKLVPNVVDTSLFYPKEEKYNVFTFIHVSNLVPLKNVKGILEAFSYLIKDQGRNGVQLVIVGNRDDHYKKEADDLGLLNKYVYFRGEVPYTEVAREMQLSHCLLLNSDIENSPCVIGEALCCGLPVIATSVGGIPELVNESNGILVPPRNKKALAEAMKEMVEKYTSFNTKALAESARKKFNYNAIGKLHDEAYCQSRSD